MFLVTVTVTVYSIVIGPVCGFVTAGGQAGGVRTLYYSQRARSVCVSLSAFFIQNCFWKTLQVSHNEGRKTGVKMEGKTIFGGV